MSFAVHSRSPDCSVVFFPFASEDTSKVTTDSALVIKETLDAHDDILECSTSKPKGAVGTFSVLLSPRKNYKQLLHPGCWCMIYMSDQKLTGKEKSEENSGFKMLGIVRTVRRKEITDPATGTRSVRYMVAGEDFQSVFNTPIYINANLTEVGGGKESSIAKAILVLGDKFQNIMTPSEMVGSLIDSLLGSPTFRGDSAPGVSRIPIAGRTGQPYKVPAEVSTRILSAPAEQNFFTAMITLFLQQNTVGRINVKPDISGTIRTWSIIQSYCHQLLNELYTDLLPVQIDGTVKLVPSLVFRPIPFSSKGARAGINESSLIEFLDAGGRQVAKRVKGKAFSKAGGKTVQRALTLDRSAHFFVSRNIPDDEIMGLDTGKTDRERFNFFFIPSNYAGSNQPSEIAMLVNILNGRGLDSVGNTASIVRYGLRPYISASNYMLGDKSSDILLINNIVKDLWTNAYLYESGIVQIIGTRAHIPVGTNISFDDRDWIAHVEKVDHNYSIDPSSGSKTFRTLISFSRLQNADGTPIDAIEDYHSDEVFGFDPTFTTNKDT